MKRVQVDIETREAIVDAIREANEVYNEVYLTGSELSKQISMFTSKWLENYGWKLPRERIVVTGDDGVKRVTRWGYPLHKIQRMIEDGMMRDM